MKLRCPNPQCRVTLSIPGEMQGQRVQCAGCGHSFFVPMVALHTPPVKPNKALGGKDISRAA